ncbi:MAG: hypothetical protein COB20_01810 [SAR86 cluster bacterium]|uniref:Uncharacterized protein n=1 Tax=SAR86 cluster bacterium TaxID=2030880 RepID=A0A2A4XH58_9GAMM|nr:MAG: hypothetical protein COB20_01810 [SAR86 cluster bacterium]
MRNPSQALAWSAFSLSWPALLTQIAGVVSVIFLIDLALDSGEDTLGLFKAADFVLLVGLVFIYSVTIHKSHSVARTRSSLGFPYRTEFSLPVSTQTLLLTPLLFFCVLTQIAVFVPGIIVNLFYFNTEISVISISFMIFQFTILTLMLSWWTENGIASVAGWLLVLTLYLNGLLMPEFGRVEDTWVFIAANPSDYFVALFFTAALLLVTYFGVKQQRSGETLIEFGKSVFNTTEQGAIRESLPLPITDCPTHSSIAAEFWKERQLHGGYSALFAGLIGTAITIAILAIINFTLPEEANPNIENAWFFPLAIYGSMCVGLTIYMYGVRYKNGAMNVSLHDRTTPLSTAWLALIRTGVSLCSSLLAGMVMVIAIWILGPFLISNFEIMQNHFLESVSIFSGLSILGMLFRVCILLVVFLTALLLLATFFTWSMLYSRPTAIVVAIVPAYIFLWAIVLMVIYGDGDAAAHSHAVSRVFANHLWILVLLIPVSLVIMMRHLLHNCVLTQTQMITLSGIGVVFVGLNFAWLFGANNYDLLARDIWIVQLSYLVMQGLLPLLAAVLALWTSNRIRHG